MNFKIVVLCIVFTSFVSMLPPAPPMNMTELNCTTHIKKNDCLYSCCSYHKTKKNCMEKELCLDEDECIYSTKCTVAIIFANIFAYTALSVTALCCCGCIIVCLVKKVSEYKSRRREYTSI